MRWNGSHQPKLETAAARMVGSQSREANRSNASVGGAGCPRSARRMARYGKPIGAEERRGGLVRRRACARRTSGTTRVTQSRKKGATSGARDHASASTAKSACANRGCCKRGKVA